jgi:PAS domain S-box-containing protein
MHGRSAWAPPDLAEAARLLALRRYAILDTPPEAGFDTFTRAACRLFGTPASMISFVDADRQWFKSRRGFADAETPRDIAFCAIAIQSDRLCLAADTRQDPRFADNPLVAADPPIRFYAGAPLITPEGHRLGTLCVLDHVPHDDFTPEDGALLTSLAAQVMTELELRRRTAELGATQRRARLGGWRWPRAGRLVECSDEIFGMFGVSPAGFPPNPRGFAARIHPDDRRRVAAALRAARRGDDQAVDFRIVGPDGAIRHGHAEVHAERADDGRTLALVGICQDITERRESELALHRSEKLHAIGQLTGGLAHDFNNLLTVIGLNMEFLEGALPDDDERMRYVRSAMAAAGSGADLIGRLLAFARRQPLAPEQVDINDMLTAFHVLADRSLGVAHHIRLELAEGLAPVAVDRSQLESVLLNLVVNARDAMPEGGEITITTEAVHFDGAYAARHDDVRPGRYAMIAVRDPGTGIPPALLVRVFEPFFTTKPSGKGSGLGLSMVQGFAKQSGGHLTIESRQADGMGPGGTCLRLYLPLADGPTADASPAPAPAAAGWLPGPLRVLVVEDRAELRDIVTCLCRTIGMVPTAVETADAGLARLRAGAEFDLLLTDVMLPGTATSVELAAEAIRRLPSLKVLFTSADPAGTLVHGGRLDAGIALLSKPYSTAGLLAALRRVVEERG